MCSDNISSARWTLVELFSKLWHGSGIHEGAMHIQDMIKFNVQQTDRTV